MIKPIAILIASFFVCATGAKKVKIPERYAKYLKADYQKSFDRISGLEKSALHWNNGIVIYCNDCRSTYHNNFIEYQKQFESDDEDEDEDEEEVKPSFKKYKVGTVFAKDHFMLNKDHFIGKNGMPGDPNTIAVMIKQKKGYDPALGDWEFGYFTRDGTIIAQGKSSDPTIKAMCTDCHKNIPERDYIFSRHYRMLDKGKK